jgi:hypothetical protein
MDTQPTDSERRLRAVLRAFMSTGVWLLIAAQLAYPMMRHSDFFATGNDEPTLALTLAFGVTATLVSAGEVIAASREMFVQYVWLVIKAGLLFGLILTAVLTAVMLASGETPQVLIPRFSIPLSTLFTVLPVLLLWWLPGAFVTREFRLGPSLKTAWHELVSKPARSMFPALLMLLPGLVLLWVPSSGPVALTLALEGAGMLTLWMANIYCLEWLKDSVSTPVP